MDINALTGPNSDTQNVGGHTGRWRFSPIDDFATIAVKLEIGDVLATTPEDLINIPGNHTWDVGKGYYGMYNTRDSAESECDMNQERDTTGITSKFTATYPGAVANAFGVFTIMSNTRGIMFAELFDGTWEQLGSARCPAEIKWKWSGGKNQGKYRGFTITCDAFETTFQIYAGTFTAHP
jgi:hypothetical protein